jgi:hypothetical protein
MSTIRARFAIPGCDPFHTLCAGRPPLKGEQTQLDVTITNPLITKKNAEEFVKMYRDVGLITD